MRILRLFQGLLCLRNKHKAWLDFKSGLLSGRDLRSRHFACILEISVYVTNFFNDSFEKVFLTGVCSSSSVICSGLVQFHQEGRVKRGFMFWFSKKHKCYTRNKKSQKRPALLPTDIYIYSWKRSNIFTKCGAHEDWFILCNAYRYFPCDPRNSSYSEIRIDSHRRLCTLGLSKRKEHNKTGALKIKTDPPKQHNTEKAAGGRFQITQERVIQFS